MKKITTICNPYKKTVTVLYEDIIKLDYIQTTIYEVLDNVEKCIKEIINKEEVSLKYPQITIKFQGINRDCLTFKNKFGNAEYERKFPEINLVKVQIKELVAELIGMEEIEKDVHIADLLKIIQKARKSKIG